MSVALTALSQTTSLRPAILASLGKAPWAIADQMLISATNFITVILLARGFSQASLGSFTLVYSALLFVNSIQAGLVTQPHNILGATRRGDDYARYTTSTALFQLLMATAAAMLALLAWMIARLVAWDAAPLLLALAPAIVAWQLQEFSRRVLYTEGRVGAALANDLLSYGGQAFAIAALWHQSRLTGALALYVIAASSAIGALFGLWQIRSALTGRVDACVVRENWHFGKWVAGGEIFGHWLSAQLFVYLAAGVLGTAAAGVLRAVHTVFGPSRVLADVFCTMLPIRFARTLADGGKAALHSQLKAAYLAAIPLLGGYCLLVAVAARPILYFLYGEKYLGSSSVLALYALSAFISYMTMIVGAALRATRLTRQVFMTQVAASLIAFPIGWFMIVPFGIHGTVLGMIVSYLAMVLLLSGTYRRQRATHQTPSPIATSPEPFPAASSAPAPMFAEPEQVAGPGLMMMRIFQLLDEASIPYCVLHGYNTYPHSIPSDVDCMIPADVLPHRLGSLLHENRVRTGAQIVQWVHEDSHYVVLAGRNPDGSPCFLQLDISPSYELANRVFYNSDEILQGRRRHGGFWIPSPSAEFGCTVIRRIVKSSLARKHERTLSNLYHQDPAACDQQLVRFWPPESADLINSAAVSGDWTQVQDNLPRLRRQLLTRFAIRHPLSFLSTGLARNARRFKRWAWPIHGLSVVFLGPDGAGKSSVVRAVRQDLAPAFFSTTSRSFPPALLNRGSGANISPHAEPPRSWLSSIIRAILYWFVYHTIGYLFTTRKDLARFWLVLHDRHLIDTLVDPRRYRYSGPMPLLRLICSVIPKPDLVILLDAPPELIQSRKQELPLDETTRQREAYWRLVTRMPNGQTIDAAQPLGQVVADVDDLIIRHLAHRAARQLALKLDGRPHCAVARVLQQFLPAPIDDNCIIEQLGRGDQADVFVIRYPDARRLFLEHRELVIKLYRATSPNGATLAQQEYDSLRRLNAQLDGKSFHGWTIHCPLPLHKCERPLALVMTKVPGRSFNHLLNTEAAADTLHSAGQAAIHAMRQYWSAEGQIYGDLDFNNILCDPPTAGLSFVDPGMPESTYLCPGVARNWFPASRDLAYMLFDVAASLKASMANPLARRRQKRFVEANLSTFIAGIGPASARQSLLEEIHACTRVHVRRINLSWSPVGLFRFIVRRNASRCVRNIVRRLKAGAQDQFHGV